jgi:hypothetical protein
VAGTTSDFINYPYGWSHTFNTAGTYPYSIEGKVILEPVKRLWECTITVT